MKTTLAALAAVLALASPLLAEIKGQVNPKVYGFAVLSVEPTGGATKATWRVTPQPVQKEVDGNKLRFGGKPGVVYTVTATVIRIDWKAQTFDVTEEEVEVWFGDKPGPVVPPVDPPPPPGPNPPPQPPPPLTEYEAGIRDAIKATGFARWKELAAGYDAAAVLPTGALTVTQLRDHAHAKIKASVPTAIPEDVIGAITPALSVLPPQGQTTALTKEQRTTATNTFSGIATAIRKAGEAVK